MDAQLSQLESRVRDLKFDYERYFIHDIKTEPLRKRDDVDRQIIKLSKVRFFKASQKFTFENIIARYVTMKTLWDKRIRELESSPSKKNADAQPAAVKADADRYRRVYDDYVKLLTSLNPSASVHTYENIKVMLESKHGELLTQYKCKDIEYKVEYANKKLKFKAIPKY